MTKKHLLILLPALLLLGGCETKDKVTAFWAEQAQKLMMTPYGTVFMAGAMQYALKTQQGLAKLDLPEDSLEKLPWDATKNPLPAEIKTDAANMQNLAGTRQTTVPTATKRTAAKPKPRQQEQFMEISIEDDSPEFKGVASVKDQKAMHQSIDFIKNTNQQAVGDVQRLMGNAARDEVILLNTRTEKKLEKASLQAQTLKQYQQQQNTILQQHKQQFQKILAKYQHNINNRAGR